MLIVQPAPDPDAINRNSQRVFFQEEVDLSAGNAGVYLPDSAFNANLVVERLRSTNVPGELHFHQNWVRAQMFNLHGNEFDRLFGLVYVYFNLNERTRALWDGGDLKIFRYAMDDEGWVPCAVHVLVETKNQPHGRLSCVAFQWSIFGLAELR